MHSKEVISRPFLLSHDQVLTTTDATYKLYTLADGELLWLEQFSIGNKNGSGTVTLSLVDSTYGVEDNASNQLSAATGVGAHHDTPILVKYPSRLFVYGKSTTAADKVRIYLGGIQYIFKTRNTPMAREG